MANEKQLKILKQGVDVWNAWRRKNPGVEVDLSGAELSGAYLSGAYLYGAYLIRANLSGADLSRANLRKANLYGADLSGAELGGADLREAILLNANLSGANLYGADLSEADLSKANLSGAILNEADLTGANLRKADLSGAKLQTANLHGSHLDEADLLEADMRGADLSEAWIMEANLHRANLSKFNDKITNLSKAILFGANLTEADLTGAKLINANLVRAAVINTNLEGADLSGARIYGISAWNVNLKDAKQNDLVITNEREPTITVDNLGVAQFIYLLLNNNKIRDVIDTITSKVVLILGRFGGGRWATLNAMRNRLRELDLSPVMFDFSPPKDRDLTETVSTLAHMARFVIADLTDASSVQQELTATVPTLSIPYIPIIKMGWEPWSMSKDFKKYHWMLPLHEYKDDADLLVDLEEKLIPAANEKREELRRMKEQD
ncbi:MAG: pentapeptide repeat-containing protein [Desulfomonilaceae bacterium]|nr:pentapeptide repeat-containing protein [Desulfomonilaceae bacterium]